MGELDEIVRLRRQLSQAVKGRAQQRNKVHRVALARNRMNQGLVYWRERAMKAEATLVTVQHEGVVNDRKD